MRGLRFTVEDSGFEVQDLGLRVGDLLFGVWGLRFRSRFHIGEVLLQGGPAGKGACS